MGRDLKVTQRNRNAHGVPLIESISFSTCYIPGSDPGSRVGRVDIFNFKKIKYQVRDPGSLAGVTAPVSKDVLEKYKRQ